MPFILDGTIIRDQIRTELTRKVSLLSLVPKLVIIQVGNREDSQIYIRHKKLFGESIGVSVEVRLFPEDVLEDAVLRKILKLNGDPNVHGITVQLPLPLHIPRSIIEHIDPQKDVDALTQFHSDNLYKHAVPSLIPATARGICELLDFYNIKVASKHVAVFGRSEIVGRPVARVFSLRGSNVSVVHSQTSSPRDISKDADIIVVVIGKPGYIDDSFINDTGKQVVIDVGINKVSGKTVGDVDHTFVAPKVAAITPVPGGVGPLTVACVFKNLIDLVEKHGS